jgi:hypothetical protein
MNGSQTWLSAWKTMAENRRQMVEQALAKKPVNPALATIRDLYLKRAQAITKSRLNFAEAYVAHAKAMSRVVGKATEGASSGTKGSVGDSG